MNNKNTDFIKKELNRANLSYILIEGQAKGFILAREISLGILYSGPLFVKKEYRRQTYGSQLKQFLEKKL